jgi:excisionase family DNA binding protein
LEDHVIKRLLAYSKGEAAAATSLSVRGIDYLIEKGQLRAVKIGRLVLVPSRELERLIEKGTTRILLEPERAHGNECTAQLAD